MPPRRRAAGIAALKSGKHVMCEKPFALNVAQAAEMRDAAQSSGRTAMVGHEFRHAPQRAYIRQLLGEFPQMPATVIAERIGWAHSMTVLKDRVRELRPLFRPPDPCQRTSYLPGEPRAFITAELTLAEINPAMADPIPLAAKSLAVAEQAIDAFWSPASALS